MFDVAELGTNLAVRAHPDDDIFQTAGLMAAAADNGQRVVDVTATRGEGGSMDEERWPPERMGEVRTDELLRSLEVLGVKEHRFLEGPVDIDMQTPLDPAGAEQVRTILNDVDPDPVLTFGPEGMTGHVGHQDVSRWTGQAFDEVAKPGALLYHTVFPKSFADEWLAELAPFEIFLPGTPLIVPDEELDIRFELSPELLDRKLRSLKEHESQIEGLLEVFGDEGLGRFLGRESFVLAARKES